MCYNLERDNFFLLAKLVLGRLVEKQKNENKKNEIA